MVFTVDVVSNDSYIPDKSRLIARTLAVVDQHKGGIILFHDIKAVTAKALPDILAGLKARGYSVVHMQPKEPVQMLPDVVAEVTIDAGKTRTKTKDPVLCVGRARPLRNDGRPARLHQEESRSWQTAVKR